MRRPSLTIGIEEEYQIVDPETGGLRSYITQSYEEDRRVLREFDFEPRLRQSVVEVGTSVCRTPAEARADLVRIRRSVADLAAGNGLKIAAAGTHPFSSWLGPESTPVERVTGTGREAQDLAEQLLIFSTHIHITVEDREFLIDAMNVARYFLPHILCLATSSPFWLGRDTGLKSYRNVVLGNFPRTGIPRLFSSWADYTSLVDILVRTHSIRDGRDIWYDLRPNWEYPTIELRICDVCTRVDEAICVAAVFQAIIAKLWKLRHDNMTFRLYAADLINENKWRAVRDGLDGRLIDLGKSKELPARELVRELIDWFIDDVVDELGSRQEVAYAHRIIEEGTSADRQLAVFRKSGSLKRVVQNLIEETNDLGISP